MSRQTTAKNITLESNKIDLAKTPYAAFKHLIPDVSNQRLSFELLDSNLAIANGIKRSCKSEISMRYLTVSLTDIFSTDPYVEQNVIRKRIEMIPIPQDTPIGSTYSIRFENKSDTYVDVLSAEIKHRGSTPAKFIQSIPIVSINSYHSFVIENITVSETKSYLNSRVTAGRIGYDILNHDMEKHSTNNSNPTHFYLQLETAGNIDPKYIVRAAIDSIIERLNAIDYSLAKTEYDTYKLFIPNETYTIGNLLARYIYFNVDPTIDYVAARIGHESKRELTMDIRHPQGELLCKKAVEIIIQELTTLKKSFK